ncbi:MAG: GNAT family N-acetyltransferase [Burkholderiaceae bacterium]|nr:GNAT family N-acetyltransferase [Burkholderiaceae bacterium]
MTTVVRRAQSDDTGQMAEIHRRAFPRQRDSVHWVTATLAAAPRFLVYVVVHDGELAGYIFWGQKSGIRPEAVIELDQIAVVPGLRRHGLGERLIRESLSLVGAELAATGQSIRSILVSTRADNEAQRVYSKVLGARVVAVVEDLYSAAEVLMVAKRGDA